MKCTREALWNVIPGIGIQHPKVEMAENKCLLQIQDEPQQSPQMIKVRIHDFAAGLWYRGGVFSKVHGIPNSTNNVIF